MGCSQTQTRWFRRLCLAMALATCGNTAAFAQMGTHQFHIAAQDAPNALAEFGAQSGLQLLFDYEAVEEIRTAALNGILTVPEALNSMLEGTGLTFVIINDRTVSIRRAPRTPLP